MSKSIEPLNNDDIKRGVQFNSNFSQLSKRRQRNILKEIKRNDIIEEKLLQNPDKFPKAVYFIIPNEFCERFCYYGISPLLNYYYRTAVGLEPYQAKQYTHLFKAFTYFFPLLGAAISDSFLGKYHTIVYFSLIYLLGNVLTSVFSANGFVGTYPHLNFNYAFWPLMLVSIGTGGIKPCVSTHGGDQFLSSQQSVLERFFQIFYLSINVGSAISAYITPVLKTDVHCFGAKCYPLAFGLPALFFAIALVLFVAGYKYYRVVPPAGEFLPWKALKVTVEAGYRYLRASKEERAATKSYLDFSAERYGADFVRETQLLGRAMTIFFPIMGFWMLYDQGSTEWQNQYDLTDKWIFGWFQIPTESFGNINALLIIIFIPLLTYLMYPAMERYKVNFNLLRRMNIGFLLVIISFILGNCIQYVVEAKSAGNTVLDDTGMVASCNGCVKGLWTLPQWIILSFGEALLSPSGLIFAYTQVGPQLKSSATSIWLLMSSLGNEIVFLAEFALGHMSSTKKMWIYIGLGVFFYLWLIYVSYYYKWVDDSTKEDDGRDDTTIVVINEKSDRITK